LQDEKSKYNRAGPIGQTDGSAYDPELGEMVSARTAATNFDAKDLFKQRCEKIGYGAPVVRDPQASELMLAIPAWRKGFHDGVEKIWREFHFMEFRDAFAFSYKLASLAEREEHHPAIHTEWGKVTVFWWTRKINGLHVNDFIMAAKTDMIAKASYKSD
jgi:4a-hydroxytetrahydrobiopterin dehydratase